MDPIPDYYVRTRYLPTQAKSTRCSAADEQELLVRELSCVEDGDDIDDDSKQVSG